MNLQSTGTRFPNLDVPEFFEELPRNPIPNPQGARKGLTTSQPAHITRQTLGFRV